MLFFPVVSNYFFREIQGWKPWPACTSDVQGKLCLWRFWEDFHLKTIRYHRVSSGTSCWWFRNPAPLGMYLKPSKKWNIYHLNWCRISSINSGTSPKSIVTLLSFLGKNLGVMCWGVSIRVHVGSLSFHPVFVLVWGKKHKWFHDSQSEGVLIYELYQPQPLIYIVT